MKMAIRMTQTHIANGNVQTINVATKRQLPRPFALFAGTALGQRRRAPVGPLSEWSCNGSTWLGSKSAKNCPPWWIKFVHEMLSAAGTVLILLHVPDEMHQDDGKARDDQGSPQVGGNSCG